MAICICREHLLKQHGLDAQPAATTWVAVTPSRADTRRTEGGQMKLYSMNGSHFASKCRIVIYEKGAPVDIVPIPGGDLQSPEYLKIYPMGKTPALAVDGTIIGESEIINEYLEERFPNPPL